MTHRKKLGRKKKDYKSGTFKKKGHALEILEKKVFVGYLYDDDERVWKKGYFADIGDVPEGFVHTSVTIYLVEGVLRQKRSGRSKEVILGWIYTIRPQM